MTEQSPQLPPLVTMGDPRLARPSVPVPVEIIPSLAFRDRLEILQLAMVNHLGIGIAAPQIGWFERFFLMTVERAGSDGEPQSVVESWINPEIVSVSGESCWAWEGCLSVPGLRGWIRRPAAVAVRGYNAAGERIGREYAGWEARIFQHEFDHLEGMLFPYRAADPRHIVTQEAYDGREDWPADWPAPGARDAPLGEVVPDPSRR